MTTIAIIGRGSMGRAHARAWVGLGLGGQVKYVVSPSGGAPLEGLPNAVDETDLEVVLADPDVDVISVCTPTTTHADIAIRALRAGKNVLLEKPVALSLNDAYAIRDAAETSSGILMVAHVVRFFDGYARLRDAVDRGELGEPLTVRAQRISAAPKPSTWWHDDAKSGGVLVDFGIHDFDQVNLFLGNPVSVSTIRVRDDGPFESTVSYEGGGVGQVLSFMGMPHGFSFASSIDLVGSAGVADYHYAGALDSTARTPDSLRLVTVEGIRSEAVSTDDPYMRQAEYFLDCVRAGTQPTATTIESAILALRLATAARESFVTGVPIAL